MKYPEKGMKIEIKSTRTPGIVLTTVRSTKGNFIETWLRIAKWNKSTQKWDVFDYEKMIQSYKLVRRHTTIPGLDREEKYDD